MQPFRNIKISLHVSKNIFGRSEKICYYKNLQYQILVITFLKRILVISISAIAIQYFFDLM